MRRADVPPGSPVCPVVSTRKIKLDPATGQLDTAKPFSCRHTADGKRLAALRSAVGLPAEQPPMTWVCDDMTLKCMLADTAARCRTLSKCDISNAYTLGKRERPELYMELSKALPDDYRFDADGAELVYRIATPIFGEQLAGSEWDATLHAALLQLGWARAAGCPSLYYFNLATGDARLTKIVDDLLISESNCTDRSITNATIAGLKKILGDNVKYEHDPSSFAGFKITRSSDRSTLTISQEQKVIDAVTAFLPCLLTGAEPDHILLKGKPLRDALEALVLPDGPRPAKLSAVQKRFQAITGHLKYFERGTHPRLTLALHHLSCVMSNPPEEATLIAESVLADAFAHRSDGITWGGHQLMVEPELSASKRSLDVDIDLNGNAPTELQATADASTGFVNRYGILITLYGAAIYHVTKKIAGVSVGSTLAAEQIATVKASDLVEYARTILAALGTPCLSPTVIGTDNLANKNVANDERSAGASRHLLIRNEVLAQRARDGTLKVVHVPDEKNPSDFLTKFLKVPKVEASLRYATNNASVMSRGPTATAQDKRS